MATLVYDPKRMSAKKGKSKRKKDVFSVTKAVKANARERVGSPPPGQVLPDEKKKAAKRKTKHKQTLSELMNSPSDSA